MAQGVPVRLRPRIFVTFGTTRVVGRQPYVTAAFTPGEIPGTHFKELSQPQGTWFRRGEPRKKSPLTTPGMDPGTVRLAAQCLNHYAILGPKTAHIINFKRLIMIPRGFSLFLYAIRQDNYIITLIFITFWSRNFTFKF